MKTAPAKKKPAAKKVAAKKKHPLMLDGHAWDKQAVMDVICNEIAGCSKAVTTILAAGYQGNTLPEFATINRWLTADDDLRQQYARAKEAQADFMAEEMAELHEKAWVPAYDLDGNPLRRADGSLMMTVDKASAAAVRLEADNKKWLMTKLRPKKYGDKITQELTGSDGGPILHRVSADMSAQEAARAYQDLMGDAAG